MLARRSGRVLTALVLVAAALLLFARPAAAAGEDTFFVNAINAVRANRGLAPLAVDGQLNAVAQSWAQQMAASGTLQHNPNVASQVSGWRALGENVGTGQTLAGIEGAFESSPHHFENMVDPEFTQIGVGVYRDGNGTYWVTENFKLPAGAAKTAAAPAPRPAAAAPKPAAKPAAAPKPAAAAAPKPVTAAVRGPAPAAPVATTVPAAPTSTVPVAVLGESTAQPQLASPVAATPPASTPFTATNVTGLVAALVLGASMALYARVRFTRTRSPIAR